MMCVGSDPHEAVFRDASLSATGLESNWCLVHFGTVAGIRWAVSLSAQKVGITPHDWRHRLFQSSHGA